MTLEQMHLRNQWTINMIEWCPDCGYYTVQGKGIYAGGGVECINPDCQYWFCF